jgi:S1-C subfamily serine protease
MATLRLYSPWTSPWAAHRETTVFGPGSASNLDWGSTLRTLRRVAAYGILLALFGRGPVFGTDARADVPPGPIADVVAKVQGSVVRIVSVQPPRKPSPGNPAKTELAQSPVAIGSGFVIDRSGLIATNSHVVADAVRIYVGTQEGGPLPRRGPRHDWPGRCRVAASYRRESAGSGLR